MASGPITSWQTDAEKVKVVTDFLSLGSKITADGDYSYEIRRHLLLGRKGMMNLDSVLKSRDITLPSGHVQSWELDHKEGGAPKIWCLWIVVLMKTSKSPWDSKEIKSVNLKGNQPWIFIEGLMLKLKVQYFGHLMWTADSLEKSLILGKIEGRRRRGHQRMRWPDGNTDAMEMNLGKLGKWWGTERPGVLQFMGAKSWTWLSDWTTTFQYIQYF